jgi:hypothetical protein
MMRTGTGFHANLTSRCGIIQQYRKPVMAPQAPFENGRAVPGSTPWM